MKTIQAGKKAQSNSMKTQQGSAVKSVHTRGNPAPLIGSGAQGVCNPIKGSDKGGVK